MFNRIVLISVVIALACQLMCAGASAAINNSQCTKRFAYSDEQFVKKLLDVSEDPNPFTVPERFEDIFSVKLYGTRSPNGRKFAYQKRCGWYAAVDISTADIPRLGDSPETIEVSMRIDASPSGSALRFRHGNVCLRPEILDSELKAEGWSGTRSTLEPVMLYKKFETKYISAYFGGHRFGHEVHGAPQSCIERLHLIFKQLN